MKKMGKLFCDQRGVVSPLLVSTILLSVLLVVVTGGFIWAFMEMTDWKNNGQAKIDTAVTAAKEEQKAADDQRFIEEEKKPYQTYQGPADLGSVQFNYPKTWSVYEAETKGQLQAYFAPNKVPKVAAGVTPYALRVAVVDKDYADVLQSYESIVSKGEATAQAIQIVHGDEVYEGTRVNGQLTQTINGSVVIFKVRDKTLQLFVDSQDYMNDFNETILKTLSFKQ